MAGVALGGALGFIPGVGPMAAAIGGTIGGIIDSKLGILGQPEPIRAPDVQLPLATEGTPGSIIFGQRVRAPLHAIFGAETVRRVRSGGSNKRLTPEAQTVYVSLTGVAAHDYAVIDQILADTRRIWIADPAVNIDSTVQATPTAGVTLSYTAYLWQGTTWIVTFTIRNTQDGSGNPQTGSPNLSVYDVGGRCGLLLDNITINGAGSLVDPTDYWEVTASRLTDANGNSELVIRAFLAAGGGAPLFSWAAKFTGANANTGVGVKIRGRLVQADPRLFHTTGSGVSVFYDSKSPLMSTLLGAADVSKPRAITTADLVDMSLAQFGNRVPTLEAIVFGLQDGGGSLTGEQGQNLVGTLTMLFERFALLGTDFVNLSEITDVGLSGLLINTPFKPQDAILRIATAHDLVYQEGSGGDFRGFARMIYASERDSVTVAAADLNARQPGQNWGAEDIQHERIANEERVKRVSVVFQNYDNSLQQATETEPFDGLGGAIDVELDLRGLTLTPIAAKSLARTIGRRAWNRIEKVKFLLPWSYYNVQEDDVLNVTDRDGNPLVVLVDQIHETDEAYEIEGFTLVEAPGAVLSGIQSGQGGDRLGSSGEDPTAMGPMPLVARVVETRPLHDDHASRIGVYVGAGMAAPGTAFEAVTVFMRRTGDDWIAVGTLSKAATFGVVPTALASGTTSGYDTTNTLTVRLASGALSSTTEALCDLGHNLSAVGSEVVGFVTATLSAGTTWNLTTLSRGRCDTAAAVGTHAADEEFLLLDDAVAFVPLAVEDIGDAIDFAFVPPGGSIDDAQVFTHTVVGSCALPLTPTSVTITAAANKLTVAWDYRSLRSARFRVPTTEPVEGSETVRLQFWNSTVAGITGDPVYEMDYPAAPGSFVIHDPHTRGITGAGGGNVACRLVVRGSTVGVSAVVSDDVAATFTNPGVADGDKGDITVSASGATWTIKNDAVTYAKMQNVSATDKLLGRSTAGAGDPEEIPCTATGRKLLAKSSLSAERALLGIYRVWWDFEFQPASLSTAHTGTGNTYQQNTSAQTFTRTNDVAGVFTADSGASTVSTDGGCRYSSNAGAMYLADGAEFVFRVALNRTTNTLVRFGLRAEAPANGTADVTDGVYLEYDSVAGANWLGCSAAAGTRTKTSTGYAASNTNAAFAWFRIKFVDGTTGVTFSHYASGAWVDDLTVATNLPSSGTNRGARFFMQACHNNAANAQLFMDAFGTDPAQVGSGGLPPVME